MLVARTGLIAFAAHLLGNVRALLKGDDSSEDMAALGGSGDDLDSLQGCGGIGDILDGPSNDTRLANHSVRIITVDKGNRCYGLPLGGTPGYWSRNVATNARNRHAVFGYYTGKETPREVQRKFLEEEVLLNPKQIIILANRDVMYTGCSDEEILARYNAAVRDTGATVLLGAQLMLWPPRLRDSTRKSYQALRKGRTQLLSKRGLRDEDFAKWANCSASNAECAEDKSYSYVNSAFMMGPVDDLLEQVKCMTEEDQVVDDDQDRVTECLFKHKDKMTMDYATDLVLSTWQFNPGVYTQEGFKLRNTITGVVQCFVHMSWFLEKGTRQELVRNMSYPGTSGLWWARRHQKKKHR